MTTSFNSRLDLLLNYNCIYVSIDIDFNAHLAPLALHVAILHYDALINANRLIILYNSFEEKN